MVKIAPSILSADFARLGEEVKKVHEAGAEFIHIDIMDGRFVPNITFGAPIIKAIRSYTDRVFDLHLMIEEPSKYIDQFIEAGADIITIHYEADRHVDRTINYIKSKGIKAGISLNPGTPVSLIKDLVPSLDLVLIMSVNPGFGGQKFINYSIDKIKEVKGISNQVNKELLIEVDGGIDSRNIKNVVSAGANVIVAGSAVFRDGKIKENISKLRESI